MRPIPLFAAICLCAALLAGCPQPAPELPPPIDVGESLAAQYLATGVKPAGLAAASDGRVFFTDRTTGQVRVIKDGVLLDAPFATVPANFAGQRGLLGIALHPEFEFNDRVYVFYARSDTGLTTDDPRAILDYRVVYFEADGDVARDGEFFVATLPAGFGTRRIGGQLAFVDHGELLVAFGDCEDPDSAQRGSALTGKILRYTEDGRVPANNPVADSPVYCQGVREPTGLSVDPETGVAFFAERATDGQTWEVNRVTPGANFGWPAIAGFADTEAEQAIVADNPDYVDPARELSTPVLGLAFNTANKYGAELRSSLFLGASAGRVERSELSTDRITLNAPQPFIEELPGVTGLALTPSGTIYVLAEEAVLRILPTR